MTAPKPEKKKRTHPWREFKPGWLRDPKRQLPHGEVKKP